MAEQPAGGGHCSGGEEAEGGESGASERHFRYLLRRQLKVGKGQGRWTGGGWWESELFVSGCAVH